MNFDNLTENDLMMGLDGFIPSFLFWSCNFDSIHNFA